MNAFNIYICGVGGQGIGLLSEVLLRGGDYAGLEAKAVDTHGLAQRGGIVVSHLRFGSSIFSPMIPEREADLVIALERHEALRGAEFALKDGGTLIYYNTVIQPLGVRLGKEDEVSEKYLDDACRKRDITVYSVDCQDLEDPRMQNIAVLAHISRYGLIPEITQEHMIQAMQDVMTERTLQENLHLFESV
jgi:indolepyruvate ferredoxin oxidoreductase beta subunit